jgi:hypothetical protein
MGKLKCVCGDIISNTSAPNNVEGVLFNLYDTATDKNIGELIDESGRDVWECKRCGRLAFAYPDKCGAQVKWYCPEDSNAGDLL